MKQDWFPKQGTGEWEVRTFAMSVNSDVQKFASTTMVGGCLFYLWTNQCEFGDVAKMERTFLNCHAYGIREILKMRKEKEKWERAGREIAK